ncbi:ribosomal-protein-alanine N-acetyltransferase [Lentzea guizhouensis]|uniref:[Ribosomal protein bS18]-alanine N-acetyltransferase n=1 Tax=Lentzea guizhouensis TaxID=1586287 RepID=A0A1B2HIV2_9PSEU|nr:ribosomal protein S18-alanine N-acetyltransferase [Lentzea guizhouensis]ANZ37646.1 ribosomal-protein-alanine N-acetyltransferase [Lentzea guizhouensis]
MTTGTVTLAPLQHADVPKCHEIELDLFPGEDPWSETAFHSELDRGNYYKGAYCDGELIGYAGLAASAYEASVHTIAVARPWQGKGVGKLLLRDLLARVDEINVPVFLEVRTDNEPAIAMYLAHGFERLGLRRRYYQPSGADAYTMGRPAHSV